MLSEVGHLIEQIFAAMCFISVWISFLFIPFFVFKIGCGIVLQKFVKPKDYLLLDIIAYLLLLNGFFYLSPLYKDILFTPYLILYTLMFFVYYAAQEVKVYNPPLYCYLANIFTVTCIQSKLIKIICFILGLIVAFFTAFLCREVGSLLIFVPVILGFASPFILVSLIKAFFYPKVFQQLFTIPSAPQIRFSHEPSFLKTCLWVNQKELYFLSNRVISAFWYEQIRYRPVIFILFYLTFIYSTHLFYLDSFKSSHVIGIWIVTSILLLMAVLNRKLSFIIPPIAFIIILISLLWSGSSFTLMELIFLLLVVGSSVTNFRLQRLADNQLKHKMFDIFSASAEKL